MPLSLRYSAISDVGRVRENNEDSGYAGAHLLVVADGMGGAPAGDVASAVAVQVVRRLDESPPDDLQAALVTAVRRANDRIGELIAADPALDGMGTTLTAALFDGERIGLAHIGDSRAYLMRGGELRRLTRDHTVVQALVDEGSVSEEEARSHPHRSLMLRVLDGRSTNAPDLSVHDLDTGDRLLLCTDGLPGFVADDAIAAALADGTPDSAAVELVQLALGSGSSDNVTCVVADVVGEDAPRPDGLSMLLVGAAAEQPRAALDTDGGFARRDTSEMPPVDAEPATAAVDPEELRYAPRPPRRWRWLRRLAVVAVVAALAFLVGRVAYDWTQRQYYVGADGDNVAIYRGLPGELPGISLSQVYEPQELSLSELPGYAQERVAGGIQASDLDDARSTVQRLRDLAGSCTPAATRTPMPTAPPIASARPSPATAPSTNATPTAPLRSARQPATPRPTASPTPPRASTPAPASAATPAPPEAHCAGATPTGAP